MEYKKQPWGFEDYHIGDSWDLISTHKHIFLCLWNSPAQRSVGSCKQFPAASLVSEGFLYAQSNTRAGAGCKLGYKEMF